ncbi:MAG: amino acid ABC transporter substrate-binding protein, partial [Bradyrhizobium sp.]|nr:amino acid ABC transporter substrate-binding protein [Bradyrhizobium sp.]
MKRVTLALTFALAPILASVGAQADTLKTVKDRGMLA